MGHGVEGTGTQGSDQGNHRSSARKEGPGPLHSHPKPQIKTSQHADSPMEKHVRGSSPFLNPDLVGWSNKAHVIIARQKVTALIDSGAQVFSLQHDFWFM